MFSQTTEYALRAATCLAMVPHRRLTRVEIAELTGVPTSYLSKVMQALIRAGIADGQRGPGGGFALAGSPGAVTVLAVIEAVEPMDRIVACPLGIPEHQGHLCSLHRSLDEVVAATRERLGAISLQDLLATDGAARPLCRRLG